MFCYQCQETANNSGCTKMGVCGKRDVIADEQDTIIFNIKKVALYAYALQNSGQSIRPEVNRFTTEAIFSTITNANFDGESLAIFTQQASAYYEELKKAYGMDLGENSHKAGVMASQNDDVRSLRELVTYGLKGLCAYTSHAYHLGFEDDELYAFIYKALALQLDDSQTVEQLTALTLETGSFSVKAMALLDKANSTTFGNPEVTKVNIGVRKNPAILVSGHDLHDIKQLLEQSKDSGVDIYTHSEMLPTHYYPELKKYSHLAGNYGNAWHKQLAEFASFNGPVLFTTNCIVPKALTGIEKRVFTTNATGFPGCQHIIADESGKKDFSQIIALAKTLPSPTEIETGEIIGGFAHQQVFALADKVVEAVKSGAIRKFIVMGGCDGHSVSRNYYTEFAQKLPTDTVILTAGCAKFRYNKLALGDIGGIPRVLDAGQCNDSYSIALIALKLQEVFGLSDINELPIVYNIAWYEQKAVAVLLALLSLGVKNIHLGPTLPAFLSPNVAALLVNSFGIAPIGSVDDDLKKMVG